MDDTKISHIGHLERFDFASCHMIREDKIEDRHDSTALMVSSLLEFT